MPSAIRRVLSFLDGFLRYGLGLRRSTPTAPSKPIELVAAENLGPEARALLEKLALSWWNDDLLDDPLEAAVEAHRPAAMLELLHALGEQVRVDQRSYAASHCIASIGSALPFIPGADGVESAIAASGVRPRLEHWDRATSRRPLAWTFHLSARVGAAQDVDTLAAAVTRHASDPEARDLLAASIQEILVRGGDPGGNSVIRAWWKQLAEAAHPMAWLPLAWTPIERQIQFTAPPFERGSKLRGRKEAARHPKGRWVARARGETRRTLPHDASDPEPTFDRLHDDGTDTRLCEAIAHWELKIGCVFRFPQPIAPGELRASAFRRVPYASGATWIEQVSAADVVAQLFEAGASIPLVESGALGRLVTLRTLGALVGATSSESVDDIVARAEATTFVAPHGRDLMVLIALRPDGTFAALAGSERDD